MNNHDLIKKLNEIGDFFSALKDSIRSRAYYRAANTISKLDDLLTDYLAAGGELQALTAIGPGIAAVIERIIKDNIPAIEFVLPKKIFNKKNPPPYRLHHALKLSEIIVYLLKKLGISGVYPTGGLRRHVEVVEHLSFIVDTKIDWQVLAHSAFITEIQIKNKHSRFLTLYNSISFELYQSNKEKFFYDYLQQTGSVTHLKELKNLRKISPGCKYANEEAIYHFYGLPLIVPELRENKGEITAAKKHTLPHLITIKDIKGDLHCHTNETDGVLSLEKVVANYQARGYEYMAITDHSQHLKITRGLDKKRLFKQIAAIDKLNAKLKGFTILKSLECDILLDGSLDFPNDVLKELDLVVCSVHSHFRLPPQQQTERMIRAIENPYCSILGHPTGRLINTRLPHETHLEKILQAAKDCSCVLELNCQPYRLDLNADYCRQAKLLGIKIAISNDSHSLRGLDFIALGITQARRGWLEPKDVINTYNLADLRKIINYKRSR